MNLDESIIKTSKTIEDSVKKYPPELALEFYNKLGKVHNAKPWLVREEAIIETFANLIKDTHESK